MCDKTTNLYSVITRNTEALIVFLKRSLKGEGFTLRLAFTAQIKTSSATV